MYIECPSSPYWRPIMHLVLTLTLELRGIFRKNHRCFSSTPIRYAAALPTTRHSIRVGYAQVATNLAPRSTICYNCFNALLWRFYCRTERKVFDISFSGILRLDFGIVCTKHLDTAESPLETGTEGPYAQRCKLEVGTSGPGFRQQRCCLEVRCVYRGARGAPYSVVISVRSVLATDFSYSRITTLRLLLGFGAM